MWMKSGVDADLVEGAAQEHLVGGEALEVEHARRQEHHLLARRGEEVLLLAAVLEVGDRLLAGLAEVEDGVADLLAAGPERRAADRLQHQALHPPVGLGAADARRSAPAPSAGPRRTDRTARRLRPRPGRRPDGGPAPCSTGTLGPPPASDAVNHTPAADSSEATTINPSTSQTPRRAATVRAFLRARPVAAMPSIEYSARVQPRPWRPGRASATLRVSRPRARPHLLCGSGGMADALASGASPGNRVEVQVLSSAPRFLFLHPSSGLAPRLANGHRATSARSGSADGRRAGLRSGPLEA